MQKWLKREQIKPRNESAVMKIRKSKIINSLKREYIVSSATQTRIPNSNFITRMPKWSNVRKTEKVEISENVTPAEKIEIFNF